MRSEIPAQKKRKETIAFFFYKIWMLGVLTSS